MYRTDESKLCCAELVALVVVVEYVAFAVAEQVSVPEHAHVRVHVHSRVHVRALASAQLGFLFAAGETALLPVQRDANRKCGGK